MTPEQRAAMRATLRLWKAPGPRPDPPDDVLIERYREALIGVMQDLMQCRLHRTLCVHEEDALKIVNAALS